ncbi:MAG: hypothetical protein WDN45_03395 [Caulobacteraceae bacterium]
MAKLDRLGDLGLELAEALVAQAKGTGPQVVEGDVALAYDRVARAVRMAVMLQSRLIADARLWRTRPRLGPLWGPRPPPIPPRTRKDQVARIVKRVAESDDRPGRLPDGLGGARGPRAAGARRHLRPGHVLAGQRSGRRHLP